MPKFEAALADTRQDKDEQIHQLEAAVAGGAAALAHERAAARAAAAAARDEASTLEAKLREAHAALQWQQSKHQAAVTSLVGEIRVLQNEAQAREVCGLMCVSSS